ncbi:double-strand-break repair protein rad21-like protein 1 [Drosophila innubila]|uniref:double-strand-break repair protein rad21-like protein 1 n=1 Tax=Drosophila innubila TaxID=198719 RepID=UPI00148E869F|nr:double-strand-break repair protein rad21-like protein 1 [Drosophila innubila]
MFYEHIILAKKGPLARIWLAAHWDKKITKAHVFETNIEKSVEGILQPKVKLALRTSGHLLLGVVRIYSRKAKYLLADCNEAFVKIKMAFRPGMVDLPEGHREANVNAITLPEVFHDFDTALPELNDIDIEAQFSVNQSRADEITMREDYGSLSLSLQDDGFGDIGFEADTPEMIRGPLSANMNDQLFDDDVLANVESSDPNIRLTQSEMTSDRLDGDGFGDSFGQPALFEDDLFGEPPQATAVSINKEVDEVNNPPDYSDDDGIDNFNNAPSPASSCANSVADEKEDNFQPKEHNFNEDVNACDADPALNDLTLVQNDDEGFALAPIDATTYRGATKAKRKRKLIIDEIKNISGEEMKAQLADTSDILTTLDLAPPTKRLMYWKETGGVEKLFALPSRTIPARVLLNNYNRQLLSHSTPLEDFSNIAPIDVLALELYTQEGESSLIIVNKKGRKRKNDATANPVVEPAADNTLTQSLAAPEMIREQDKSLGLSLVSLDSVAKEQDSIVPQPDAAIFDKMQSPLLSFNDMDNFSNLNEVPLTPRDGHLDMGDDFHHGDLTPAGLDHGQMTPHHAGIGDIDCIPNLPPDQVSSILNETEDPTITDANNFNKTCEISTDWNDYDFPPSVGLQNVPADEQMENETDEQFEERVLNKRAAQLFLDVRVHFNNNDHLTLSQLTVRNSRKQAAQKFYSLLVLKKFKALNITQPAPYADITVTRGPLFDNPKL